MNYEKIQKLIDQNKVEKMKFYKAISLTHAGFARMMKEKTLRVETLELIAQYFNVPLNYFFETIITNDNEEVLSLLRENRELNQEIRKLRSENEALKRGNKPASGQVHPKLVSTKK